VFLGGGRIIKQKKRECYLEGRADYDLISQTPAFKRGIERVIQGAAKMRVALMCAEKDPIDCHRCILVSPHLRQQGLQVLHVLSDGTVENHEQIEQRLLQLFALDEKELFRTPNQLVAEAY